MTRTHPAHDYKAGALGCVSLSHGFSTQSAGPAVLTMEAIGYQ
jgi:hypothetical protein